MHPIFAIDWHEMLVPTVSLLELVLRGSVVYLFVFAVMRFFHREAGALSTADLIVIVLVADAAQNAMTSKYHSLPEGLVLVATIFAWNFALDWLAYHSPRLHRLLNSPPLILVKDGRIIGRHLRSEMLTRGDLDELLREQGINDLADVRRCYLESDGHLSVLKRLPGDQQQHRQERSPG